MRLKKLTLQAFGPFKDKVEIDFEGKQMDRGLLLISGDTGAGKTTIFDAICYALYGETSSKIRTANSLRSDWASSSDETFVELEFYYKNKLYRVRRSPEYLKKKKIGDGETKQSATAEFEVNGRMIVKPTEVTKEMIDLIGLDYNQFRQVAMLSQGEFTKFLLANSEEKTEIFRKIFDTEIHQIIQFKLKENKIMREEGLKSLEDKMSVERVKLEQIMDISNLNEKELLDKLDERIKEDTILVTKTKEDRDKKNEDKTKLSTELDKINKTNSDIKKYNEAKDNLDILLKDNKDINKDKELYEYNINVVPSINKLLDLRDRDLKNLSQKKSYTDNDKLKLDSKKKEYEEKEESFKMIDSYSIDVDKLNNKINDLTNKYKDYNNYLNKTKELDTIKIDYNKLSDEYNKQNSLFESMRKQYYMNISVEIADTLIDGEECPVCGSKDHPHKATSIDCDFTKDDLDKLENDLKQLDNRRKSKEASIEELGKTINELNISKDIDVEKEIDNINELLNNKKKEKEELDNKFKVLSSEKQQLLSDIKSLEDNINIYIKDIEELENDIKECSDKLEELYKDNKTSFEDYMAKKLNKVLLLSLKNRIDNYDTTKNQLESTIKLLEDEVKDKKIVDISDKEKELNQLIDEYKELDDKYTSLNSTLGQIISSKESLAKYYKNYIVVQHDYGFIKLLSDTANGALTQKRKITYENYVQSYFMKSVLVEANKRLIKMTDSRYELRRKENDNRLNVKIGLDFSIFDSYTGKERDVSSLSGGEKFKASLALALGLSDTISNNRGGIKIDSLFIDEGFGSLDPESLNQALNILNDLSGNDRLVGVISHVAELMNRIDNKILVNKTNTGSVINI